jgi:SAM-dependent methyltransferase
MHPLQRWLLAAAEPPLYAAGLGSGLAAVLLQRLRGYLPTDYSPADVEHGVSHVREICGRWERVLHWAAPGESFLNKRVLELGPGQSLGTGLVLLARGAVAYTAVDVFPLAHRSAPELYTALASIEGCSPELARQAAFQIVQFPTLAPLADAFDVAVSNSTLEHVEDIPATFRALRRLVGGFMVHHVDARVHLRLKSVDPLNHLRYGANTYRLMHFKGVPNRLLSEDYRRAALDAGFTDIHILPRRVASAEYVDRVRSRLAPPFRDRPDLGLLSFTLFAR